MREPPGDDPEASWLLVSDADDTLLGHPDGLRRLTRYLAGHPEVGVVVNSSRPVKSVSASFEGITGFRPRGFIGALGTEVEIAGRRALGWASRFGHWDRQRIHDALAGHGFEPHIDEYQGSHKVSFTVPPDRWHEARRAVFGTRLAIQVIESAPSNFDVLPRAAGKAAAARYVARRLRVPLTRVVTSGDSANDWDLLRVGFGVAVGNARFELLRRVQDIPVHLARGRQALGVLEGLTAAGAFA
ncbi:MAG TPA: HAD family hydrolase [Acidimicrobiia bacterium]|nr:HAD family hydrolase [Acidimicrobiia bacterium]